MSAARSFMRSANASSVPASASASATAASLPDCTMMPRSRFSTLTSSPSRMNIFEPPIAAARAEVRNSSSIEISPLSSASKAM